MLSTKSDLHHPYLMLYLHYYICRTQTNMSKKHIKIGSKFILGPKL
jgi:hypothetical protein